MTQGMVNKPQFMVVGAFLSAVSDSLSENLRVLARAGKLKPTDSELYVRKAIGNGGGTINLLEGINAAEIGITNFDGGNRLDTDRIFVIDGVTLNYGTAADGASPKTVDYSTALPSALKNSNLVIKQDDAVVVRIPVAAINDAKSTDVRYRELSAFGLLKDNKTVSIQLEMPSGSDLQAGAGNTGFVEVLIKGMETYTKN